MVRLKEPFDPEFFEARRRAEYDAEGAAEILRIIARRLRNKEPLGEPAANFLADAFETAVAKPEKNRLSMLGQELKLKTLNRRPKDWFKIGKFVYDLISASINETQAIAKGAKHFDVSPSTSRNCLNTYRNAKKVHDSFA